MTMTTSLDQGKQCHVTQFVLQIVILSMFEACVPVSTLGGEAASEEAPTQAATRRSGTLQGDRLLGGSQCRGPSAQSPQG